MKSFGIAALAITLAAGAAFAQDETTNRVSAETDWSVFQESDPVECFAVSGANPAESVNTRDGAVVEVQRGELPPTLYVSFKPAEGVTGQVTFTGGAYGFNEDAGVTLVVDGSTFALYPQNVDGDGGTRGTISADTFSLLGFTAAVEEAERRCAQ